MVDQNPDSDKYRLGIKLFELGMAKMRGMEVRKVAFPYLTKLHNEIEETVFPGCLPRNRGPDHRDLFRKSGDYLSSLR